ncbi:MAG: hypothetical protein AAFQ22_10165 [Pseudomonadota bacterium]
MRAFPALIAPLAFLGACASVPDVAEPEGVRAEISVDDLVGEWDVSLFFSPTAPPSKTVMVVEAVEDGIVTGSFYGSPFLSARAITFDEDVLFTATTEDGSGVYITQGELEDDEIEGTTYAVGRDFLMAWRAVPLTEGSE